MDCFELKEFLERAHTEKLKRLEEYRKELKAKEINLYHKETELERALKACQWISVKDRLPEEDGTYLISYILEGVPRVACANYADGKFYMQFAEPFSYHHVTAWQPGPEPYKGDE
jgi:hypothetical protein